MKKFLKCLVALITLMFGLLLGIILLSEFIWWRLLLFAVACSFIGQFVYRLLRIIDRKFSN